MKFKVTFDPFGHRIHHHSKKDKFVHVCVFFIYIRLYYIGLSQPSNKQIERRIKYHVADQDLIPSDRMVIGMALMVDFG